VEDYLVDLRVPPDGERRHRRHPQAAPSGGRGT
jgi:hypothetical protein